MEEDHGHDDVASAAPSAENGASTQHDAEMRSGTATASTAEARTERAAGASDVDGSAAGSATADASTVLCELQQAQSNAALGPATLDAAMGAGGAAAADIEIRAPVSASAAVADSGDVAGDLAPPSVHPRIAFGAAARSGNVATVKRLLGDARVPAVDLAPALHAAAGSGHLPVVQALIGDARLTRQDIFTAALHAGQGRHMDVIDAVSADPRMTRSLVRETVFSDAAAHGRMDVVTALLPEVTTERPLIQAVCGALEGGHHPPQTSSWTCLPCEAG